MAHMDVVRRSMQEPEWIAVRRARLEQCIVLDRVPVSGWRIRHARQTGEGEYEFENSESEPLDHGDMIFSPDGTVFLEAEAEVPEQLAGKEIWLEMATAAEMIVKCNGRWAGGLDPNRERVPVREKGEAGETLCFRIEGYNRSKPDDERDVKRSSLRGCRQVFGGASLVTIDREAQAAVYDVRVLEDTMNCSFVRGEIRAYIMRCLDTALNIPGGCGEERDPFRKGIGKMRDYLQHTVFRSRETKGFAGCGRVALVAHSHLDIAYYWRRVHAVQKNARTCLIQLRLMDRYPEFTYAHTQPYTFELLETRYPDLFKEVKERVDEGRFELVGGMYVEPDCNIPTAESLVRQCVYGQLYCRSRFGRTVNNCWLPDVFGNTWILPQILKLSGMDYFVSNKMSTWNDTNRFPHNHFLWRGIDGTEVGACVPPTHFITWNSPSQVIENWDEFQEKETCAETLNMFGYGDGGSGVTEQMLEYARRIPAIPGLPEVRHIRGDRFLEETLGSAEDLEVWDGELYLEMHRGTFTTKGKLKRENRQLEILLRDAEILSAFSAARGSDYPRGDLTAAWKLLLINQFHDILPGTHISPVTRDALADYAGIHETASRLFSDAAQSLGLIPEKEGSSDRVILLNTLTWPRKGPVFAAGDFAEGETAAGVPCQSGVCAGERGMWMDVQEIPALSAAAPETGASSEEDTWYSFDSGTLETPFFQAEFRDDGSFGSLIYRKLSREIAEPGGSLNRLAVFHDYPGKYDAWDIRANWEDREEKTAVTDPLKVISDGPVCMELGIGFSVGNSSWRQTIRFFRTDPRIEFEHEVDWHERNRLAKAMFDFNMRARSASCDTSAGTIVRPVHRNTSWEQARFEVCHHKWAALSEGDFGVAVLNDSKYGISFRENHAGVSLLRGSVRPDPYADEGRHCFRLALLPYTGSPESAGVPEAGWAFNVPVYVFRGGEPLSSLISIDTPDLHLQAAKCAEDPGSGLVVRLCEIHGNRGTADISFAQPVHSAVQTDLLEDTLASSDVTVSGTAVRIRYRPWQILTLRVEFGGPVQPA